MNFQSLWIRNSSMWIFNWLVRFSAIIHLLCYGSTRIYSFFINDDPIENIFYLIKIHLASNHASPNFSEDYKKTTKASPCNQCPAEDTATLRSGHIFLKHWNPRTFIFSPDLVLWESDVQVQQHSEPRETAEAEVSPPGERIQHFCPRSLPACGERGPGTAWPCFPWLVSRNHPAQRLSRPVLQMTMHPPSPLPKWRHLELLENWF